MSLVSQAETIVGARQVASRPAAAARTVLISMNPRAGSRYRHDRIREIEAALSSGGFDVQMTSDLAELAGLATQMWHDGDLRAVIAMGGDGTAAVVRNQVPLMIPLLPVPMGTENLLGRYTRQTSDAAAVRRTVTDGVTVGLDLGRANGKYFLLMISAGFDAEVVRSLHENRRGNIRRTAYLLPVLQAVRSYRYPEMEVYWEAEGAPCERPLLCRWLFGFNFPLYGLGLSIAPDAVATDGLLDVCAFERGRTWSIVRYLWHLLRGGHLALSDASLVRARRFRLATAGSPNIAYQLDGDHGGELPVDVEVLPGELRLLVSRETAGRLGFALPKDCGVSR
jgi:diacylglycerol kinase family enzyme